MTLKWGSGKNSLTNETNTYRFFSPLSSDFSPLTPKCSHIVNVVKYFARGANPNPRHKQTKSRTYVLLYIVNRISEQNTCLSFSFIAAGENSYFVCLISFFSPSVSWKETWGKLYEKVIPLSVISIFERKCLVQFYSASSCFPRLDPRLIPGSR